MGATRHATSPGVAALALWLAISLVGCSRLFEDPIPRPGGMGQAPNLAGRIDESDGGASRTQVEILDVIRFGETRRGPIPETNRLVGYEFEAFAGSIPVVELRVEGPASQMGMAVYGPRSRVGVWGDPIASVDRLAGGALLIDGAPLPAPGLYLILLWHRGEAQGTFELRLGCRGNCAMPGCPDLTPCELVCQHGFVLDGEGCRICECVEVEQRPCQPGLDQCPEGELCAEPGRCVPVSDPCDACPGTYEPVCGRDQITYGNACRAECRQIEIEQPGACPPDCDADRPCPEGLVCVAGACVAPPTCAEECADVELAPVCDASGRTWATRCLLDCDQAAAAFEHEGPCPALSCQGGEDCLEPGEGCLPVEEPANLEACALDPVGAACLRGCRPMPETSCDAVNPCAEGLLCRGDRCTQPCDPLLPACPDATLCVATPSDPLDPPGLCQPTCDPDRPCPERALCMALVEGQHACVPCDCPADRAPVCSDDNHTWESACQARCAGVRRFRPGACEDAPVCICPLEPRLACAADGRIFNNLCEARCAEAQVALADPDLGPCLEPIEPPIEVACAADEGCWRTGCEDRVCAAAESLACPNQISEAAACTLDLGRCECQEGRCGFAETPMSRACVMALRPPPP